MGPSQGVEVVTPQLFMPLPEEEKNEKQVGVVAGVVLVGVANYDTVVVVATGVVFIGVVVVVVVATGVVCVDVVVFFVVVTGVVCVDVFAGVVVFVAGGVASVVVGFCVALLVVVFMSYYCVFVVVCGRGIFVGIAIV